MDGTTSITSILGVLPHRRRPLRPSPPPSQPTNQPPWVTEQLALVIKATGKFGAIPHIPHHLHLLLSLFFLCL